MESFFAAIEAKRRPELAGVPVVVAKSSRASSGVVVSASPEAKALGVSESMTVRHAQRLCPQAMFVQADYALYRAISAAVMDALARYSPLVEPESLDRAWVDVTESRNLFGGPRKTAADAIQSIEGMGYRACAGAAANKLVAQVASSKAEPGKVRIVAPGDESAFLAPLAVDVLPGIGEKTKTRLFGLGVRTVGQLAAIPERLLVRQFGPQGERIHRWAIGADWSQVRALWPPEIIKIEHMFPSVFSEPAEVEECLRLIADRLALELRGCNRLARTATLELIIGGHRSWVMGHGDTWSDGPAPPSEDSTRGGDFRIATPELRPDFRIRQARLRDSEIPAQPWGRDSEIPTQQVSPCSMTHDPCPTTHDPAAWRLKQPVNRASEIYFALRRLLSMQMKPGMEIIGVSVTLSDLTAGEGLQLSLLGPSERRRRLDRLMETIRTRFGDRSLVYASSLLPSGRNRVLARIGV